MDEDCVDILVAVRSGLFGTKDSLLARNEGDPILTTFLNSAYNLGLLHSILASSSNIVLTLT